MDEQFQDLLVQIRVPTTDGQCEIATGYPIGPDRILTARHALFPADRDEHSPITVCWYHQKGPNQEPVNARGIVWDGGQALDAAILDVPFPDSLKGKFGSLSRGMPSDHGQWASEGFARAGRTDDERQPVPMWGTTSSMASTATTFHLGVDHTVEFSDDWKGASGSPVFVGRWIVGVIETCPKKFNASRLIAVASRSLLDDPTFQKAMNLDERLQFKEEVLREVTMLLEGKDELARSALARAIPDGTDKSQMSSDAKTVAQRLLGLTFASCLKALDVAHGRLCASKDPAQCESARMIDEVGNWLLAAVSDDAIVQRFKSGIDGERTYLFDIPIATATMVEIIMAGAEGRPVAFRLATATSSHPRGERYVESPPISGRDDDVDSNSVRDFISHVIGNMQLVEEEDRRRNPKDQELLAIQKLKQLRTEHKVRYYYVFVIDDADTSERARWDGICGQLGARFPDIVFLKLSSDIKDLERERAELYHLGIWKLRSAKLPKESK